MIQIIYTDFPEQVSALEDAEVGRLVLAMARYARGETIPPERFSGNERFLWPMVRATLDRQLDAEREMRETNRINGAKGGRPKKPGGFSENRGVLEKTDDSGSVSEKTLTITNNNNLIPITNNIEPVTVNKGGSLIQQAQLELGYLGERAMNELVSFLDELPEDVILYGIQEAGNQGKRTWAYAKSILNRYAQDGLTSIDAVKAAEARHKQASTKGQQKQGGINAQDYTQRAYTGDMINLFEDDGQ